MGLYPGGLIIGRIFVFEIWGAYFREGLFWGGLLSEFYGIFEGLYYKRMARAQTGMYILDCSSLKGLH